MKKRKIDHIAMAFESQVRRMEIDQRFNYEPLLGVHLTVDEPFSFLGKTFRVPLWVSSMTGGTKMAYKINRNLARVCKEFGFGMGLGSCRILLEEEDCFPDFDLRDIIGPEQALFANLGIAQMESMYLARDRDRVNRMVEKLRADGLIIHVNPLQESLQPGGDVFTVPPIEIIEWSVRNFDFPLIVKEVGQGMGPGSLERLLRLPLAAIEFAAFGGTNFARLELMRGEVMGQDLLKPISRVGHDAFQMTEMTNDILERLPDPACKQIIVSGGINSFLDGYYLINKLRLPAIYGQACEFLRYAGKDYDTLRKYTEYQVKGLRLARSFLGVR